MITSGKHTASDIWSPEQTDIQRIAYIVISTFQTGVFQKTGCLVLQLCDSGVCQLHCLSLLWHACTADTKHLSSSLSFCTWGENCTSEIVSCIRDQLRGLCTEKPIEIIFPFPSVEVFFPEISSNDIIEYQRSVARTMKLSENTLLLAALTG